MNHSSPPLKSTGPRGLSSTAGLVFLTATLTLGACSGGVDSRRTAADGGTDTRILSGFVGSPSLTDATVTVLVDDGATAVSARSGGDASYSVRLDKSLAPPIRIQAEGGTDLLTGAANETTLTAVTFEAVPGKLVVSHLSTLATRMAACRGTTTRETLTRAWSRLEARTGLDFLSGTGNLTSEELGALMRADLALAETAERTRAALSPTGGPGTAGAVLDAIACDLEDDGELNASVPATDTRLISVFRGAEASVLLEMIAGTPYLGGQQADVQMDETLRRVSGNPAATIAHTPVPDAMLDQAGSNLALLDETFDDPVLLDLAIAVTGSPAEATAETRTTLDAGHLTTLWALPERVALADETQMTQLTADLSTQSTATVPVVSLSSSRDTVSAGQTVSLSWASAGARRCRAAGDWQGSRALEGTFTTRPINEASEFRLYCRGLGGVGEASTQVGVVDPTRRPVVSLSADDPTLDSNQTTIIRWTSSNATACTASGAWSGSRPIVGSTGIGPLSRDADYTLSCTGPGGTDTATLRVTVTAPEPPPASDPAPTLTFNVAPGTIESGQSVSLSWSTTDATACTASGGWSGSRPTSGSASRGPLTSNTSFSLTCTGPGGSVTRSRSVTVTAASSTPPPTVSLSAASTLLSAGGSTSLSWSTTNATACTASGGWSGSRATSGSASVGPISRQTTFSLSCSGTGGSALAMVSVSVRGSVSLNWVAPTENVDGTRLTDLAGYRVYYGTSSRRYTSMRDVTNPSATSTTFTLASGDYYVAMTALDGAGNESAYSNEVLKTVQ